LPGKDEIVLSAVETPAEERTTLIDRASRSPQIYALTIRFGGKHEYRISRDLIRESAMPVRLHVIPPPGVKKKTLIAFTTLGAIAARHVSLFHLKATSIVGARLRCV